MSETDRLGKLSLVSEAFLCPLECANKRPVKAADHTARARIRLGPIPRKNLLQPGRRWLRMAGVTLRPWVRDKKLRVNTL